MNPMTRRSSGLSRCVCESRQSPSSETLSLLSLPLLRNPIWFAVLLPVSVYAQAVSGTVVDAGNQAGVATAEVSLFTPDSQRVAWAVTGGDGVFVIGAPQPGKYFLEVGRIGYQTVQTQAVELDESETVRVRVELPVHAVALEPLTVLGKVHGIRQRELWAYHQRLDRLGNWKGVRIFPRDELAKRETWTYEEFVRRVSPRVATPGKDCKPVVFWNGHEMEPNPLMTLGFFEGIEFYEGFGPKGSRYVNYDHCGVVLVWSRAYFAEDGGG